MEPYLEADQPEKPEFVHFLERANAFFQENEVEPIKVPASVSVKPSFGHALVEFFNEINHYPNPMNDPAFMAEKSREQRANLSLGQLYYTVSEYLHALHVPIDRKGVQVIPDEKPEQDIKLWRRVVEPKSDGSYASHIEEVSAIDPSKKAVICVGGTASIHGHVPSINGLMKIAEKKLGGPEIYNEGLELYCVSYPAAHRPSFFADTHHYNANPEFYYSKPAQQFADRLIIPGIDSARHPDVEHLKEVFSRLNIFAYSYGTVFVQEVRNYLSEQLLARGYEKDQVAEVFAEAYAMNIGPTCRLDVRKETGNFSSVYVLSPNDLNVRSKTHNHVLVNALATANRRMKPLSENELLIYSDAPLEGEFITPYDEKKATHSASGGGQLCHQNPSYHGVSFYTESTVTPSGEAHVPRYLSYHMSSAVGTSGAYKELDERFIPPAPDADGEGLRTGNRVFKDAFQLYMLEEITKAQSVQKR